MMANVSHKNRPYFQQLQQQFAAHIRDPEHTVYAPETETPIESRRLKAYQELFFNNIDSFFSQLFPVSASILGRERWLQILREYLVKHQAKTPLFHELGEEFLLFLNHEFDPRESDPPFLLELAHYEWVELALSIATEDGFEQGGENVYEADLNLEQLYELSPLAWPLAYEWPVHQLSVEFQPNQPPESVTTLLVFRHLTSNQTEIIDFIELTPLLYQVLMALDTGKNAKEAFEEVANAHPLFHTQDLVHSAQKTLKEFVLLGILRPVRAV